MKCKTSCLEQVVEWWKSWTAISMADFCPLPHRACPSIFGVIVTGHSFSLALGVALDPTNNNRSKRKERTWDNILLSIKHSPEWLDSVIYRNKYYSTYANVLQVAQSSQSLLTFKEVKWSKFWKIKENKQKFQLILLRVIN